MLAANNNNSSKHFYYNEASDDEDDNVINVVNCDYQQSSSVKSSANTYGLKGLQIKDHKQKANSDFLDDDSRRQLKQQPIVQKRPTIGDHNGGDDDGDTECADVGDEKRSGATGSDSADSDEMGDMGEAIERLQGLSMMNTREQGRTVKPKRANAHDDRAGAIANSTNGDECIEDDDSKASKPASKNGKTGKKSKEEEQSDCIKVLCEQFRDISISGQLIKTPEIFTGNLDGCSLKEHVRVLKTAYDRWFGEEMKGLSPFVVAHIVFGFPDMRKTYSEEMVGKVYAKLLTEISNINIAFEHLGIMDDKDSTVIDYQRKINRMYEVLYNAYHFLSYGMRLGNALDSKKCNASPEKYDLSRFQEFNASVLDADEQLIFFIESKCAERFYRKVGDTLYEEIHVKRTVATPDKPERAFMDSRFVDPDEEMSEGGEGDSASMPFVEYGTYAWKPVCTIRQFIIRQCNPRTNLDMWRAMYKRGNLDRVAKYIADNPENTSVPDLKRDRTVSAWRNGLWFAEYAAFYPYSKGRLPPQVCASQFIDQEFDNTDYGPDFMNVPCIAKRILSDQNQTKEEQSFTLGVAFGRLIFEPGKYDNWEIIAFLWGLAQTGKSCLLDACIKLFDIRDVQGVGNNLEKQFGLQDLVGKMLWVANDVKKNFAMDAGDLQTICSLELMSVAVKHKNAISVKWDVPGIIAGNEIPRSWTDSLGALERRVLLIDFPNSVKRDNSVKLKLTNERSLFYRIVTYAYHHWQKKCGTEDIWDHCPKRFRESRKIIQEHENPIAMFFNSDEVEITKDYVNDYVKEGEVISWFKEWTRTWGHYHRTSPAELRSYLKNRGVKFVQTEKVWPPPNRTPQPSAATATTSSTGASSSSTPVKKVEVKTCLDGYFLGMRLISKKKMLPTGMPGQRPSIGGNFGNAARMGMGKQ